MNLFAGPVDLGITTTALFMLVATAVFFLVSVILSIVASAIIIKWLLGGSHNLLGATFFTLAFTTYYLSFTRGQYARHDFWLTTALVSGMILLDLYIIGENKSKNKAKVRKKTNK